MRVTLTLSIPDDFYVESASDADVAFALLQRFRDAFDREWPNAPMDTIAVDKLVIVARKEGK